MTLVARLAALCGLPNPYPDLAALSDRIERGPSHIWIEPTNRCNTRCRHCEHYHQNFGADISDELYEKITSSSVTQNVRRIDLVGYGEPLLARHFDRLFDDWISRGSFISFTTNGILLRDEERLKKFVRSRIQIVFSIDGACKETYELARPYIKWEKTLETLEMLKNAADEAGSEKQFSLRFNFVAMKDTLGGLPDVIRLGAHYGVHDIMVLPLSGEHINKEIPEQFLEGLPEPYIPAVRKAVDKARRTGIRLLLPPTYNDTLWKTASPLQKLSLLLSVQYRRGLRRLLEVLCHGRGPKAKAGLRLCMSPWQDTYFSSDGRVEPCCFLGNTLGDMNQENWDEIWNGQHYRSLRRTIHSWNPTSLCRYCGFISGINGGYENHYDLFFSGYDRRPIPLDQVHLGQGFYDLERTEDGSISHVWMRKGGELRLPPNPGARFLRLHIIAQTPGQIGFNCGTATVNNQQPEPFDNTCRELNFPIEASGDGALRVKIEMENEFSVAPDPRRLALAISGAELLF